MRKLTRLLSHFKRKNDEISWYFSQTKTMTITTETTSWVYKRRSQDFIRRSQFFIRTTSRKISDLICWKECWRIFSEWIAFCWVHDEHSSHTASSSFLSSASDSFQDDKFIVSENRLSIESRLRLLA